MLTVQDAFEEIDHAINARGSVDIDRLLLLNRAGALFFGRSWRWLESRVWTMNLGANMERTRAPRDCSQVLEIQPKNYNDSWTFRFVDDYSEVLRARRIQYDTVGSILAANWVVEHGGESALYVEAYPAPAQSVELQVRGRVKWGRIESADPPDKTVIPLPSNLPPVELAFVDVLRAYARGHENDAQTTMSNEITMALAGPLMAEAVDADRRATGAALGPMKRTAIDEAMRMRRVNTGEYPPNWGVVYP